MKVNIVLREHSLLYQPEQCLFWCPFNMHLLRRSQSAVTLAMRGKEKARENHSRELCLRLDCAAGPKGPLKKNYMYESELQLS